MTKKELDKIEHRAHLATPGPFYWAQVGRGNCDSLEIILDGRQATCDDQELFAHAQHDIVRLCEEVRRLRTTRGTK